VRIRPPDHVKVEVVEGDLPDPTQLYEPYDALILPRRYGGLCLPAQEAASMGLPVIMTNCPPQSSWLPPELAISSSPATVRTQAGILRSATPGAGSLVDIIDRLVSDPALVGRMSDAMDHYAESISWVGMKPLYDHFFEAVAAGDHQSLTRT
jgi:glycosyltransferase involved in cell wall biosynthesis